MELLKIERTSLTVLFDVSRPAGQLYIPDAIHDLAARYSFIDYPKEANDVMSETINFRHGKFQDVAFDLTVYRDGVVLASRSDSDLLDQIYDDVVGWFAETFGVNRFKSQIVDRMYDSIVIVESDVNILKPWKNIEKISGILSEKLASSTQLRLKFEPFGFTLYADTNQVQGIKPGLFKLERRGGFPKELNQYFSVAPLRTKDHIDFLVAFENIT